MSMERNSSSVLAKLMGFDRHKPSNITHQRHRVLSDSYFQNISSIVPREKSQLGINEDELLSEGSDRSIAGLHLNGSSSSSRNRLDKKFLSKTHRVALPSGSELRGSSYTFSGKTRESSDAQVLRKSKKNIETGSYMSSVPKERVNHENDYSRKSSFLSRNLNSAVEEPPVKPYKKRTGINFQKKRVKNLNNSMETSRKSSVFTHDIAKQVTKEMKQSVWHSYREPSKSGSTSDESSVSEHERIVPLSQSFSELDNYHKVKSLDASVTTSNVETQNTKKQIFDKWRTRKSFPNQNANSLQVSGARYLAKPWLFPSAWVFRGKSRPFILDKNWCLKPRDCGLITVDSQRGFLGQEAFSTPENSLLLEKGNTGEAISTTREDFIDSASIHDVDSPTYHDVTTVPNENENKHSEGCNFPKGSVKVDSEELVDVEDEKTQPSVEFQWERLSDELSKCAFVETTGSNFPDNDKEQLKGNAAFEPWSPVSSLEGPEACRQHSDGISSVPEFFSNDLHGLQAKLQLIEAASLESGSEGPGMMVSSEDSDECDSVHCYREDAQITEMPFLSENRQFSYLNDLLTKSGFLLSNSNFEAKTYCSLGYVLDPSLFKSLEEKYSKQTLWERSDRKLLFDRINLSLMEIVYPPIRVNISRKSVAKRLIGFGQDQKTVKQLWGELLNQEEGLKKKSCDKLYGCEIEWLEVDENVSLLVEEMEFSLIDELIEEFVKGFFQEV